MASGATIRTFDELGVPYIAKWDEEDHDRLLGLVFTFETCQQMWKRFPDCLSLDNTYRTNALGFVVTTQTNINSIANVAFGLIGEEDRESFDFLASGVNQLREKIGARRPEVLITDKDQWMRGALRAVFPDAQLQLCRYHMYENVKLQAKKKGKWAKPAQQNDEDDDEDGLRDV